MYNKPVIGILGRIEIDLHDHIISFEKSYVSKDEIDAIAAAGGLPIVLPVILDDDSIKAQIEMIDGLLVPGGGDVNPLIFGEEPMIGGGFTFNEVDEFDIKAIKFAYKTKKPIFGICRGIQVLNVAFGGTLIQDLKSSDKHYVKHLQDARKDLGTHTVEIMEGTALHNIIGKNIITNSYHHQAIKDLAKNFIASAYSKDGVIEAIENKDSSFIMAVQWHPEMMIKTDPTMLQLFKNFISEVDNSNNKK